MLHDHAIGSLRLETLHTLRLRLEPLEEAHAKALFAGLRNDALYEFTSDRAPESVETLAKRSVDSRLGCRRTVANHG